MAYGQTKRDLNQAVADLSQFAANIHQTHWYLRGPEFLTLHPLLDDYLAEVQAILDEVAERLIQIGGAPYSTLAEFQEHTQITSEPGTFERPIPEWFEKIAAGYRYLSDLFDKGIKDANHEGDRVTEDLFIASKAKVDKKLWMVQAKLTKAPGLDHPTPKWV